ncbi:MAG: hypothetical protein C6P37_04105 [Caldibacillus debilis]|uniref:Uncharacterized protein n=1 Tax=Caldibacillus debilis TaxID=301148 RepID=A0A3E0K6J5_9BACI|nr:MAG: hypothetical protein C6P37_04105 [Caldibacillus debilis]
MLDIFIRMLNDPVEMMDDRPGKPEQMLNVLPQILNKRDFLSDDSPKSWAFFFEYGTVRYESKPKCRTFRSEKQECGANFPRVEQSEVKIGHFNIMPYGNGTG